MDTFELTRAQELSRGGAGAIERVWVFAQWTPLAASADAILRRMSKLPATDCAIVVYHQWFKKTLRNPGRASRHASSLEKLARRLLREQHCDVHFLIYPHVNDIGPYSDFFIPLAADSGLRSILLDLEGNWKPRISGLGMDKKRLPPEENVRRFLTSARNRRIYDDFNAYFVDRMNATQLDWGVYSYGFIPLKVIPFARIASYIAPDAQGINPSRSHDSWRRQVPGKRMVSVLPAYKNHAIVASRLKEIPTLTDPRITEVAFWRLGQFFTGGGRLNRTGMLVSDLLRRTGGPTSRPGR